MSVVRLSSRLLAPLNSTVRSSACSRYGKLLASGNRKGFVIVGAAALSTSSSDNNSVTPFLQAQPHQDQFQQLRKFSSLQKNQNQMTALPERRQFSTQEITKNLTLYSSQPRNVEKDPKTLKLKHEIDKPLVVMFSWLLAKQKNLLKYAKLYTDQGYDVLTIEITPWQLLWPTKGAQLVTADVVKFLESNASYSPLILHGFSIGGYVWGECMVEMAKDMDRYRPIFERIVAQIWDSAADIPEIPIGFPKSVFPRNPMLQNALRKYTLYHLKTFHEQATIHYIRSSEIFHYTLVRAPALFLLSKNDPIGSESSNRSVRDAMESLGIKCTWKCWDRSAHVLHYKYHTEEYLDYLFKHLEDNHIGWRAERLRAKL
ncbi:uncharacterized protein LOC119653581 isoform X2 [Hermetia illucens]|uniref:uncharacterized protein LOC119653581 isoform X2 n=1 Tax=Hermetia illucens TaxID=343691 RepID=UPI0018CBFC0E|nr:uncharacterized protein LOC119653581 isoform X2 [Hermetia illucens]